MRFTINQIRHVRQAVADLIEEQEDLSEEQKEKLVPELQWWLDKLGISAVPQAYDEKVLLTLSLCPNASWMAHVLLPLELCERGIFHDPLITFELPTDPDSRQCVRTQQKFRDLIVQIKRDSWSILEHSDWLIFDDGLNLRLTDLFSALPPLTLEQRESIPWRDFQPGFPCNEEGELQLSSDEEADYSDSESSWRQIIQ